MPSRRAVLAAGLATAGIAHAPVTHAPVAQAQGTAPFVVATYGGLFETVLRRDVIPAFEAAHGVRVVLEVGLGTTFLPKLLAARGRRAPYDVAYVNDDEAILGDSFGLWAPDLSARMPNMAALHPSLRAGPALPLYTSIVYDFPLLHRTSLPAMSSWEDLWRLDAPVGVPHISNSYGLTFLLIAALLNGGGATDLSPAFPALKRLRNTKVWRGVTQGVTLFQQGEAAAGLMYNHRGQQLIDGGAPLAMLRPKEGVWGQRTGVQVPKGASRPELSAAWADLTLGVPYQSAFAAALYSPSNAAVPLPDPARFVSGDRIAALRFPDWAAINPQRDTLADRWAREMG